MGRLFTALAVLGLATGLGSRAMADDKDKDRSGQEQNQKHEQTIHGVIGGVTAEGDLEVDYRTKQAVMVESAYLTVIGSPAGHSSDHQAVSDKPHGRRRHNVYLVAISPKTKVCKAVDDSGKACDKKDASLNDLEVGDRVEIQFQSADASESNSGRKQTDQMRSKHGRHRTYFGIAREITIVPHHEHDGQHEHGSSDPDRSNKTDNGKNKDG